MMKFVDIKWPEEYNELTRIEELLHCKICYEYIETSVITPCSHNYCSLCIRKFLHYKTQCPICFNTIFEKDLHANRVLDEFTQSYLSLREKLLSCIKGARINNSDLSRANFTPVKSNTPNKTSQSLTRTPVRKLFRDNSDPSPNNSIARESQLVKTPGNKSTLDLNSSCFTPREKNPGLNTPGKNIAALSAADNTPKINSIFAPKGEDNAARLEINRKRVPCPVCRIEISESNINRHLDDCLKRQRSMSPPKTKKNNLEPMPKYVLNLMKDSELRKLLKKYGLSTSGVRKAMEKRLQKFSALYNAERDKLAPKSVEELVKLCEGEENAERNMFKQNSSDLMPGVDRKADLSLIEKAQREYLARNKDDYQKLIETINSREKSRSRPNRSLFGFKTSEESICVASTSSASQTTVQSFLNQSDEANETNSSAADMNQWLPQDSDSTNTSYPLQHYSNEDPMQWLALEMSSDTPESNVKLETSSSTTNDTSLGCRIKTESPEQPMNLSDALNSSCRNDTPLSCRIKTESSEQSMSVSDVLNSGNGGSTYLGEMNESIRDIFDASTEDNWSDSNCRVPEKSRSKKFVMKRSKVEENCQSTDSDTDVETSPRFAGRRVTKTNKKKARENGKKNAENKPALDFEFEARGSVSTASNKLGKENAEADSRDLGITRRSSRKRNHVSYAAGSKGKNKPLKEVLTNVAGSDVKKETSLVIENTDQPANPTLRSLRKRPKR